MTPPSAARTPPHAFAWGGNKNAHGIALTLPQHRQRARHQGHEAYRHQRVALQAALALDDALDDLRGGIAADRHDQDAAHGKLVDQRLWTLFGGGGDDDAVERRLARPALAAVADIEHDVVDAERDQQPLGLL